MDEVFAPNSSSSRESTIWEEECDTEKQDHLLIRIMMFVPLGVLVCMVSICANIVLAFLMFTRLHALRNNLLYMAILTILDILLAISYTIIFPLGFLAEYFEWIGLYYAWHIYLIPLSTICQITLSVFVFLIVAASIEKFCSKRFQFRPVHSAIASVVAIGLATLLKVR